MSRLSRHAWVRPIICGLTLLAAIAALLAWTPQARAGFADQDVTRASLAGQRANYLLDDAEYAADVARDDFERSDRRAADLALEVDRQQRDLDEISRRFDEAARSAKWLDEDLGRASERADARRKELDAAAERLRAARAALDQLTDAEVAKFEAGEPFKALAAAVDGAGKAMEAVEKAALDALAQTDEHRAATAAAEALDARVKFLTEQGDAAAPDELNTAKKELAAALDGVRRLEDQHLSSDPAVKSAEERLAQAEQSLKSAQDEFRDALTRRPEIADARNAATAEQRAYDDALRAFRAAETRAADASEQLKKQEELVVLERDRLAAANDRLNRLLDEVREADAFATASDRRLRDALEAVEYARRERDAASWSLARAGRAGDAFYGWDAPVSGFGGATVHVGRVYSGPRPLFSNPVYHRPAWSRPLTDFDRPHRGRLLPHGEWVDHTGDRWDDDRRPVVVKVVHLDRSTNASRGVRATARENAARLASRTSGDEKQRQQRFARQVVVETRRNEVAQRQMRLSSFGAHAGAPGAGAIAVAQADAIDRKNRQRAAAAERATRAAGVQAEQQRGGEGKAAVDAHREELRQRQLADAALARREVLAPSKGRLSTDKFAEPLVVLPREGALAIRPSGKLRDDSADGRRLRWAERRQLDAKEREQAQQARRERDEQRRAAATAAAIAGRPPTGGESKQDDVVRLRRDNAGAKRDKSEGRGAPADTARDAAQEAKSTEPQAARQAPQREAGRQIKAEQDQVAEQARRQAAQAQRQQETEARRQQQAADAARDAARDSARQQAAAEQRSRRDANREANEAARSAQREASRQAEQQRSADRQASRRAEQQRSAERNAARSAERVDRQAAESRRSESRQQGRNNDRSGTADRGARRRR